MCPRVQVQDWSSSDEECEDEYEMDVEGGGVAATSLQRGALPQPHHAQGADSEDSNAESYYANSYPDEVRGKGLW